MEDAKIAEAAFAFEGYLKEEYPEEGADGGAFLDTPVIDHFIAGYEAGKRCHGVPVEIAEKMAKAVLAICKTYSSDKLMNGYLVDAIIEAERTTRPFFNWKEGKK